MENTGATGGDLGSRGLPEAPIRLCPALNICHESQSWSVSFLEVSIAHHKINS